MRFTAFINPQGQPALGVATSADELIDVTALGLPATLDELLRQGDAGMKAARAAVERATTRVPRKGLRHLPPIAHPAKAFAIGLNYTDHAAESNFERRSTRSCSSAMPRRGWRMNKRWCARTCRRSSTTKPSWWR